MIGVRDDLIVPLGDTDLGVLVEFWRWLLPSDLRPWFATALGDLFLNDATGRVWWLDVGTGELSSIARNAEHFEWLISQSENRDFWYGQVLVDDLRRSGLVLRPGECYSYQQLPILGGDYRPGNFRIYDLTRHFRVWGPIHEKLRNIPDGTSIRFVVVNDDPETATN